MSNIQEKQAFIREIEDIMFDWRYNLEHAPAQITDETLQHLYNFMRNFKHEWANKYTTTKHAQK